MTSSPTPVSYNKKRASTFGWTILLYLIVVTAVGLSTTLATFLYCLPFLLILFALDYTRRLGWVRFTISEIITDNLGITLSYFDKEKPITVKIPWDKFRISKGTTFTRNPTWNISIHSGADKIATFYADDTIDNKKIIELFHQLKDLKTANA